MLQNRKGFTLIELLIVVVIIGILAAVAIPRFGESRERAYVSAMQSDLRQLMTAQEMYYIDNDYSYADGTITAQAGIQGLNVTPSAGVTLTVAAENPANGTGSWSAVASHSASDLRCAVFVGTDAVPTAPAGVDIANTPGVIACETPGGGAAAPAN